MKFDRTFWILTITVAIVLCALNFHCWQPGIGGRSDVRPDGSRPTGSELEIYLGFPACYRAELWRSDDPDITMQLLASAPFIRPPESMIVVSYYTSAAAALANLFFATAVFVIVGCFVGAERHRWNRTATFMTAGCAVIAIACYLFADRVSTHL